MSENDSRFSVLLHAYLAERADDTPATTSFLSLLAAILGFLTIIGFGLTHASSVPAWAIAVIPLPTIPFIAFGTIIAHASQVRGWVIDDYERRLRSLTPTESGDQIAPPYGHSLLNRVLWRHWYGKTAIGLAFLSLFPLYIGVLVVSYRESHRQEPVIATLSLIGSLIALVILLRLFFVALHPERAWARGVADLLSEDLVSTATTIRWNVPDLEQQLRVFEQELRVAGVPEANVRIHVERSETFLQWLRGDYEPGSPRAK